MEDSVNIDVIPNQRWEDLDMSGVFVPCSGSLPSGTQGFLRTHILQYRLAKGAKTKVDIFNSRPCYLRMDTYTLYIFRVSSVVPLRVSLCTVQNHHTGYVVHHLQKQSPSIQYDMYRYFNLKY